MIDFSPLRSVYLKNYKLSIDTLTKTIRKETITKYFSKEGFCIKEVKAHSKISSNVKKKLWTKEVTSSYQIHTTHFKNIILETPHSLNQESDYKKCCLTAFGLSQYDKPLHVDAKEVLMQLFNKFGVDSFDLSIDMPMPLSPSILSRLGVVTTFENTYYINSPTFSYIAKIKYYDKSFQQQLKKPLYRLELTVKTNGKLKNMFVPFDEIENVLQETGTQK